jgi:O-antigen/teichoic acid export membrane protein
MSEWVLAIRVYFATVWLVTFLGGTQAGWFGAAHRVVVSLHTFVWLYFFNLLPSLSRGVGGTVEALVRLVGRSIQLTAWVGVFLGVLGTTLAGSFIHALYGEAYGPSAEVFRWLIWLVPITLWHGHYRFTLIAYGKQRLELTATAWGAGLNVVLNLLLIPSRGPLGAAWALIASELLIGGIAYGFVRKAIVGLPMWSELCRPLLAGIVLTGVLYVLPAMNPFVRIGVAVVVYGLLFIVTQPVAFQHVQAVLDRIR